MKAAALHSSQLSPKGKEYFEAAKAWMKSWASSIETVEEFSDSYTLFHMWLDSDDCRRELRDVSRKLQDFARM
jgi:hypothetical protein